jgi:hypothetical protein
MGRDVLTRLPNVVSDNCGDATAAVKQLFQLFNGAVGYEQMLPSNHVRCSDHSVQLGVAKVLTLIQQTNEQLRQAMVSIRRSMVMRQEYRVRVPTYTCNDTCIALSGRVQRHL